MKRLIPANREEDVLLGYRQVLEDLERRNAIQYSTRSRLLVEEGYRVLNWLGYAKNLVPSWVRDTTQVAENPPRF